MIVWYADSLRRIVSVIWSILRVIDLGIREKKMTDVVKSQFAPKKTNRLAIAEAPCPDCGRMIQVFSKNGPGTWEKRVRGQMVQHLKIHGYRSRPLSLRADSACRVIRYPQEHEA